MATRNETETNEKTGWDQNKVLIATCITIGVIGGPLYVGFAFEDIPLWKQVIGGVIAGLYFVMCAIPHRMI